MKTSWHLDSAASTSGRCTIWAKCGDPISSSPSATSTIFTGGFRPAALSACNAARNVASGPFWLIAPRPIMTLPNGAFSTIAAASGGELHSEGSNCLTSYMKYIPTVRRAPASNVANTPGWPSVGMIDAI